MTFHANDFDRYPISLVLRGFFQPKKTTVFSLIKLYFRPRWTLNGSQKTSSVSDCMIISEKTTNNSLFDFCFRFPPSDRSHFPPSSAPLSPSTLEYWLNINQKHHLEIIFGDPNKKLYCHKLFICFSVGTKNGAISLDETNESNKWT